MMVAMICDQMTLTRHSTDQIRGGANRFTANTECRADILSSQDIQQQRRDTRLRTIIETQQNLAPTDSNVLDPLPNGPSRSQLLRKFHRIETLTTNEQEMNANNGH